MIRHDAFLSYSRQDATSMKAIQTILESRDITVWSDTGIQPGTKSWKRAIENAILEAKCLICLLSPDANQSEWVRAEIEFAELHEKPIYLALLRGDEKESIPFGYATMQWIDLRNLQTEAFQSEILKLVRTISGIELSLADEPVNPPESKKLAEHSAPVRPAALVPHVRVTDDMAKAIEAINDRETMPDERLKAGDFLRYGDPRRGVSVRMDMIPDIDWIRIPEGDFIYGENERLHLDTFYISRYPLTFEQFDQFVRDADGYSQDKWWHGLAVRQTSPGEQSFAQNNRPRETVSWYDAIAFTRWLSSKLNYEITLPTEQQWEKAARGPGGRLYPWGREANPAYANVRGQYALMETSPVGVYSPGISPYGVYDMIGNVWEWCLNLYDYPDETWIDDTGQRALRGGSWHNHLLKANYRNAGDADGRTPLVGFRVARPAPSAR